MSQFVSNLRDVVREWSERVAERGYLEVTTELYSGPGLVFLAVGWRTRDWEQGVDLFAIPPSADLGALRDRIAEAELPDDALSYFDAWKVPTAD